jgi:hypothetical protein
LKSNAKHRIFSSFARQQKPPKFCNCLFSMLGMLQLDVFSLEMFIFIRKQNQLHVQLNTRWTLATPIYFHPGPNILEIALNHVKKITYKLFNRGTWRHRLSGTWPKLQWSTRNLSNEWHPSNEGSSFKLRASDKILLWFGTIS